MISIFYAVIFTIMAGLGVNMLRVRISVIPIVVTLISALFAVLNWLIVFEIIK